MKWKKKHLRKRKEKVDYEKEWRKKIKENGKEEIIFTLEEAPFEKHLSVVLQRFCFEVHFFFFDKTIF